MKSSQFALDALRSRCDRVLQGVPTRREPPSYRGRENRLPSLITTDPFVGGKADSKQYTGDAMIGVATMHKSCMQPIFSQEAAIEVARMRR